jgi:hypothetical protein
MTHAPCQIFGRVSDPTSDGGYRPKNVDAHRATDVPDEPTAAGLSLHPIAGERSPAMDVPLSTYGWQRYGAHETQHLAFQDRLVWQNVCQTRLQTMPAYLSRPRNP